MTRLATVAGTATLMAGVMTGTPANAAAGEVCLSVSAGDFEHTAGGACFKPNGDVFRVFDTWADGMRVVAVWGTDYGRSGQCTNTNSANGPQKVCDYDMREGRTIEFQVCTRDGATGPWHRCSGWKETTI
ncbi:hypothetical protein ACL02R_28490 [Streptomyces sp. MS19]